MRENNHTVSHEDIKKIKNMKDPNALKLAREAKDGVNPFYHAIGTMGGISVRDKYSTVEAMENLSKTTDTNSTTNPNMFGGNSSNRGISDKR